MSNNKHPPDDPFDPEFESIADEENPYPNATFERLMNTPLHQGKRDQLSEEVDDIIKKLKESGELE